LTADQPISRVSARLVLLYGKRKMLVHWYQTRSRFLVQGRYWS
jgi:hypothetical protein